MGFFLEIFRLGLRNLRLHKLRSTLTSLGIILGVAAVIVVVAVGEGNKIGALREVAALGATNIIVRSSKPPEASSNAQARTFFVAYGLLRQDLRRLDSALPDANAVVPLKAVGSDVQSATRESRARSTARRRNSSMSRDCGSSRAAATSPTRISRHSRPSA